MKKTKNYLEDIAQIRSIMERSSSFISLSGLSGILAGIYALIGAYIAYRMVYIEKSALSAREYYVNETDIIIKLGVVALVVLVLAVTTGLILTARKSGKSSFSFSDEGFRNLLENLLIPLVAGGIFILMVWRS
jgi:predicted lysophospholipase L1 biosynthesis ABC-type transport system permease subunit